MDVPPEDVIYHISEFHDAIGSLDAGEAVDATPTLSFAKYEEPMGTLTPSVLELIAATRREAPERINEATRVVERDVKNVHEELTRLAGIGIDYVEEETSEASCRLVRRVGNRPPVRVE